MKKLILIIFAISLFHNFTASQWIQQNSGTTGDLKSVFFVNPLTGWVCGVTGSQSTDRIAKTTDGGTSWVRQNAGTFYVLNSIQFINDQTGWAAGLHGTVVKTTNGGTNWFVVFGTTTWDWDKVQFINSQTGWAAGQQLNGIYNTTDGGVNWIYLSGSTGFRDICFIDNQKGWAVKLGVNSEVHRTNNGGISWFSTPFTALALVKVIFMDQINGWAIGSNDSVPQTGKILRTTNSGQNWLVLSLDTNTYPRGLFFISHSKGWLTGSSGKIYITTNGGMNWNRQFTNTTLELKDVYFIDSLTGWATGGSGIVLKTTNGGGPVGLEQTSSEIPQNFSLGQNYPNPFNPSTVIRFNITRTTSVRIRILDIQGKEVDIPVNQFVNPGSYQIVWNAQNTSSGIYFYRIETDYFTETRKMILLK